MHAVDEAALNPWPGTEVGDHLTLLGLAGAVIVVAVAYPWLPAVLRAALFFVFFPLAAVGGGVHVLDASLHGARRADFSGFLLVLAAAGFAAAAILALASRPRAGTWPRRIVRSLVALAVTVLLAGYVAMPIGIGVAQTQRPPEDVEGAAFSVRHQDVELETRDGLRLRGWYVPSRNRAAVVVVHGGGGDRRGSRRHAAMLARNGYGVLLYDARGRGESEGSPNGLGWKWPADVDAALEFLSSRPDVDRRRIGGLGLSTGADVLVQVAAQDPTLRGVVLDGCTIWTVSDAAHVGGFGGRVTLPFAAVYVGTVAVLEQDRPPEPLADLAARIPPTPALFIASNDLNEPDLNRAYVRAYGRSSALWRVDAAHTQALAEHPQEYERRVVGFFRRALGR